MFSLLLHASGSRRTARVLFSGARVPVRARRRQAIAASIGRRLVSVPTRCEAGSWAERGIASSSARAIRGLRTTRGRVSAGTEDVEAYTRAGLTSLRQGFGGPPQLQRRRKACATSGPSQLTNSPSRQPTNCPRRDALTTRASPDTGELGHLRCWHRRYKSGPDGSA